MKNYSLRARLTPTDFKLISDVVWNQKLNDHEIGRFSMEELSIDYSLDDISLKKYIDENKRINKVSLPLYLYVNIRYYLLKNGIKSKDISDYVANLVYEFGMKDRYRRISKYDDQSYDYSTDILIDYRNVQDFRKFLLSVHLGNFSLWKSGLFDISNKKYLINMGKMGYKMATVNPLSKELSSLYYELIDNFENIRNSMEEFSKNNNIL